MTARRLVLPLAGLAFALGLTGCAGLRYRPEVPEPPRADAQPVPLRVGLLVDNPTPPIDASGMGAFAFGRDATDLGRLLADTLRGSRLFREVRYPMPRNISGLRSVDLVLNASFQRSFRADPAKGAKAVFTGLFLMLPSSFVVYNDQHAASGRVSVEDTDGKWIKEYSQNADLTAAWKLFSEARSYKEGPGQAAKALAAMLVQALIDDRAMFEDVAKRVGSEPAAAPARSEPVRTAGAAAPWWRADESAPVKASAPVEAAPPAEPASARPPSKDWDGQLTP